MFSNVFWLQAETDARVKDKELSDALERMRQYESVSLILHIPLKFVWYLYEQFCHNLSMFYCAFLLVCVQDTYVIYP